MYKSHRTNIADLFITPPPAPTTGICISGKLDFGCLFKGGLYGDIGKIPQIVLKEYPGNGTLQRIDYKLYLTDNKDFSPADPGQAFVSGFTTDENGLSRIAAYIDLNAAYTDLGNVSIQINVPDPELLLGYKDTGTLFGQLICNSASVTFDTDARLFMRTFFEEL